MMTADVWIGPEDSESRSTVTPDLQELKCSEDNEDSRALESHEKGNSVRELQCSETLTSNSPSVMADDHGDHGQALHDEINVPPVHSLRDPVILKDCRVLTNLLRLEERYLPSAPDYFRFVQKGLQPSMRKIVADWLLQVSEELQCTPEVFCLAMNYFDRFLARCRVTKGRLQLIGSVCLLLSSKFKENAPINGERLVYYSDYSIKPEEIRDWELLVLQELRWELSAVTPLDFLDQLLHQLPQMSILSDQKDLKQRTETMLVFAMTEYKYTYLNPSLLAASALLAIFSCQMEQIEHKVNSNGSQVLKEVLHGLGGIIKTPVEHIDLCTNELIQTSPNFLIQFSSKNLEMPEKTGDFETLPLHSNDKQHNHNNNNSINASKEVQNESFTILVN